MGRVGVGWCGSGGCGSCCVSWVRSAWVGRCPMGVGVGRELVLVWAGLVGVGLVFLVFFRKCAKPMGI